VTTTSSDSRQKAVLFWGLGVTWVIADIVTKRLAVANLGAERVAHEVIGDWVRFTLVYNQGAAFGMHVGEWSRWIFTALTLGALLMLAHLYRETRADDHSRVLALTLVSAGAVGNLIDRLRGTQGVVDFIDVGTGSWRFWTFNVADIGVSCGAVLLALVLWREERRHRASHLSVAPAAPGGMSGGVSGGVEHAES
jgi:signal peptidase II